MTEEHPVLQDSAPGRWDIFLDSVLPAIRALRATVDVEESVIRSYTFHTAPRGFFFWSALDEVEKTAVVLMKLDDLLDEDGSGDDTNDSTGRNVAEVILEELRLRERRLCELLRASAFGNKLGIDVPERSRY